LFALERLQKIREIILKEKRVDVTSLSQTLNVSEVTVRRDLEKLENEGLLYKTYGGAVLKENANPTMVNETEPDVTADDDIAQISIAATDLIKNGDTVFLGSGAINSKIAANLSDKKDLVIVTNDLEIANELCSYKDHNFKKVVTGGDIGDNCSELLGELTLLSLKNIFLDKAFITVEGIDLNAGYTVKNFDEASMIRILKEISKETYVTSDVGKFSRTSFTRLGPLTMFDGIISSKDVPAEYKNYFFQNYIRLYTYYDLEHKDT